MESRLKTHFGLTLALKQSWTGSRLNAHYLRGHSTRVEDYLVLTYGAKSAICPFHRRTKLLHAQF